MWLALPLWCARAQAQAVQLPVEPWHLSLAGELGYFATTEDNSSLHVPTLRASAQYAFGPRYSLAADFGIIGIDSNPEQGPSEDLLRLGNPTLFGLLRGTWLGMRYRVGLGGTVPIARIDSAGQGRLQHTAFNYAQGMDGLWEVWLYAPERAAAIAYGRVELDLDPELRLELAAAPAVLFPAYEAYRRDPVSVFVPTLLGLGSHKGPCRFGLRLKAVVMPTNGLDMLQLSLEPWLRVELGRAFLEARYTGNVDEPLAGARGPHVWGLHLAGGGVL